MSVWPLWNGPNPLFWLSSSSGEGSLCAPKTGSPDKGGSAETRQQGWQMLLLETSLDSDYTHNPPPLNTTILQFSSDIHT